MIAEVTLRELGRPSLEELLLLTALICRKQPARGGRVAARFLERYLQHDPEATINDAAVIASLLRELGGRRHEEVLAALLDMTGRASGNSVARGVRSA
jgi:hypothetical protein